MGPGGLQKTGGGHRPSLQRERLVDDDGVMGGKGRTLAGDQGPSTRYPAARNKFGTPFLPTRCAAPTVMKKICRSFSIASICGTHLRLRSSSQALRNTAEVPVFSGNRAFKALASPFSHAASRPRSPLP